MQLIHHLSKEKSLLLLEVDFDLVYKIRKFYKALIVKTQNINLQTKCTIGLNCITVGN